MLTRTNAGEPLDGHAVRHADVWVMAATHRDLETAISDGSFRRDLYYRLNTIPLVVRPLRDRLEDLSELCDHLVAKIVRTRSSMPLANVMPKPPPFCPNLSTRRLCWTLCARLSAPETEIEIEVHNPYRTTAGISVESTLIGR